MSKDEILKLLKSCEVSKTDVLQSNTLKLKLTVHCLQILKID